MAYYHTKFTDIGDSTTMKSGGYYEKVNPDTGCPQLIYAGGGPIGFNTADEPAACGSKSPEASLFAVIFNTKKEGNYHIYQTHKDPDIDISDCAHDFCVSEEVRWKNPETDPIEFTKLTEVFVPRQAIKDVLYAYYDRPHNPNLLWADQVKEGLSALINGDMAYPTNLWDQWDKENVFQPGFTPEGPSSMTLTDAGFLEPKNKSHSEHPLAHH